jgi:hypothetical protein
MLFLHSREEDNTGMGAVQIVAGSRFNTVGAEDRRGEFEISDLKERPVATRYGVGANCGMHRFNTEGTEIGRRGHRECWRLESFTETRYWRVLAGFEIPDFRFGNISFACGS